MGIPQNAGSHPFTQIRVDVWVSSHTLETFGSHTQESRNQLAPLTVKLGNYSRWNRSRDFNRAVKLPLDIRFLGVVLLMCSGRHESLVFLSKQTPFCCNFNVTLYTYVIFANLGTGDRTLHMWSAQYHRTERTRAGTTSRCLCTIHTRYCLICLMRLD